VDIGGAPDHPFTDRTVITPATDGSLVTGIQLQNDELDLDSPTMVEGLPGVGLVGKIAADHLVDALGMEYYADVRCEGLPPVAIYGDGDAAVKPPVRLYADADADLLVLQSDVPVSPKTAENFADCVTSWLANRDATPIYLSGMATEKGPEVPECVGVSTGDGAALLENIDVDPPTETGLISGPTGALLHSADAADLTGVGLVVDSDPRFPDPEAARVLLDRAIVDLAGIDVPLEKLVERAEEIRDQKEQLAERMQRAEAEESSQARPLGMYQ
jgi:uncharacterized protein